MHIGGSYVYAALAVLDVALACNGARSQPRLYPSARFVKRVPAMPESDHALWFNREIAYAYTNDNADRMLRRAFEEAQNLWYKAGLPRSFKYRELNKQACASMSHMCMRIGYDDELEVVTKPPDNTIDENGMGPFMILTDHPDAFDRGTTLATMAAHELGHAWGLHHAHQSPSFWPASMGGLAHPSGAMFDKQSFKCQDLADYKDVRKDIEKKRGKKSSQLDAVCTDIAVARKWRFSAQDYLPLPLADIRPGTDSLRWDPHSIMNYPTYHGSRGNRKPILTTTRGMEIPVILMPSTEDVQSLVRLYSQQR